jgi:hypothetical protein
MLSVQSTGSIRKYLNKLIKIIHITKYYNLRGMINMSAVQLTIEDTQVSSNKGSARKYKMSDINRHYSEEFQKIKYPDSATDKKQRDSLAQYRCSINNFLEAIGKDAAMCKREDIDSFLSAYSGATRLNKAAHIKSFFGTLITANVKNCTSKIGRDLLIRVFVEI